MIAFLIVVVLIYVLIIILILIVNSFLVVGLVLVSQPAHLVLSGLPLFAEPVLRLAHLVVLGAAEHGIVIVSLVIENLLLLRLLLLSLESLYHLCLLLPALLIFQVVHVELVLQIVNIGVLLDVDLVVALELGLKALVLFLILGLDIFQSLESFFYSLQLHFSP